MGGRAPPSPPAARAHGRSAAARPRQPAVARFWGRALLSRGLPRAQGRGAGGTGEGKGAREGGGEGRKGGNQTRKGRKGGRGEIRRERKAQSPPPAAACALRHHVRRNRHHVLRSSRASVLPMCLTTSADDPYLFAHLPSWYTRARSSTHSLDSFTSSLCTCVSSYRSISTESLSPP